MIPILYPANETSFTSNGLGRLPDATECIVTEERNGVYELRMLYPVEGLHFSDILINRFIYAVPADGKGEQPFRIYSISRPLNGIVEINAEHISYQLSHIPLSPFTAGSAVAAMAGLKTNAAEACPFTFWTDKEVTGNFKVTEPASIRSMLGGTEGSILDVFGTGEYEFDHYSVKLHLHRGTDNGVTLRYGKNITDIKQEENIANTYTGVMPYWKGSGDNNEEEVVTLTEKVLHSSNASHFPYQRTIPLDMSSNFETKPTESQLRSAAQSYMTANNIGVPAVSLDVSFIALWQTEEYKEVANLERINLCDTVTVEFPTLEVSAQAKVIKTEYDVLRDRYQKLELGEARTNFTQAVASGLDANVSAMKRLPSKSFMQKAVEHATELITGGLGGHVVMKTNADGEPEEILIMDTDDINTAVNVIRINQAGIGFSTDGYDGPFSTAWTIDGHFVADFIDTGNLNASLITAGVLKDSNSNFVLDLATGQMTMKRGSIDLGNGAFEVTDNGVLTASNASLNGSLTTGSRADGSLARLNSGSLDFYRNGSFVATLFYQPSGRTDNRGLQINIAEENAVFGLEDGKHVLVGYGTGTPYYYLYYLVMSRHIDEIKNLGSMGYSYDGIQVEVEDGSSYVIRADTSDANLKKNIADSEVDALKVINAIEHKRFDFIKYEKHRECGYVAQQLETVNEEFVIDVEQGDGSTTKQVNTFELLSYATKAIQELSAQVDALEERIATLEKEL